MKFDHVEVVKHIHHGKSYTVNLYRLARSEGWIHDFQPSDPDVRGVEVIEVFETLIRVAKSQT